MSDGMELWRVRPDDVIVLPVFPGEVTVTDVGLGVRYLTTRVEWEKDGVMSGALDLGDFTEVRLLGSLDGVNAVWLEGQEPPGPPALEVAWGYEQYSDEPRGSVEWLGELRAVR